MQAREWMLTAAVIVVPLIIAVVVTLWSLEQVRYKRKTFRPPSARRESGESSGSTARGDRPPSGQGV